MTQMILLFQVYTGFLTAWMTEIVWNALNKLGEKEEYIPPSPASRKKKGGGYDNKEE